MPTTDNESPLTEAKTQEPKTLEPKTRVQSAYRAISILLAIAESSQGLKINEIRESLGLPRQVTYP